MVNFMDSYGFFEEPPEITEEMVTENAKYFVDENEVERLQEKVRKFFQGAHGAQTMYFSIFKSGIKKYSYDPAVYFVELLGTIGKELEQDPALKENIRAYNALPASTREYHVWVQRRYYGYMIHKRLEPILDEFVEKYKFVDS